MEEKKRLLTLLANTEEIKRFELVKRVYQRKTDSDMIRFLINQEAEKILSQNSTTVSN